MTETQFQAPTAPIPAEIRRQVFLVASCSKKRSDPNQTHHPGWHQCLMRDHIAEIEFLGKMYLVLHLFTDYEYAGRRKNEAVVLKGRY